METAFCLRWRVLVSAAVLTITSFLSPGRPALLQILTHAMKKTRDSFTVCSKFDLNFSQLTKVYIEVIMVIKLNLLADFFLVYIVYYFVDY